MIRSPQFREAWGVALLVSLALAGCGKAPEERPVQAEATPPPVAESSPAVAVPPSPPGPIESAMKIALAAAAPSLKEGFVLREDYWGGDVPVKTSKAIVHQLFKGNEYWFWMGSDTPGARVSVHLYDADGKKAESECWDGPQCAGAAIRPQRTGTYYLIIEVEESPEERTPWALVYGFR